MKKVNEVQIRILNEGERSWSERKSIFDKQKPIIEKYAQMVYGKDNYIWVNNKGIVKLEDE